MVKASWRPVILALLIGLNVLTALGCAHPAANRVLITHEVAGAAIEDRRLQVDSSRAGAPEGVVDLSEPPRVVSEDLELIPAGERFAPLMAATEPASWIAEDFEGASLQLELANACGLDFDYAFAASDRPSEVEGPRRVLEGHTLQTQVIPAGDWLHLWHGDRWLGTALTTVDGGHMEVSPACDTLEVELELPTRGPGSFAIHWQIDAAPGESSSELDADVELSAEAQEQPETWGTELAGERVELRFANLCAEAVDYAFTPTVEGEPESSVTISGHAERRVEVPTGWWLRYAGPDADGGWRGGAATEIDGAVVWIAANCVDFGVGDGQVVGPGGQLAPDL
jgi:hypothetical protein